MNLRALLLSVSVLLAASAQAATIIVTDTGDTIAVDNLVTLREAITSANDNASVNADVLPIGGYGADTINFNIPGSGVRTITPITELPVIAEAVTIDGYTQTPCSGNPAPCSRKNTLAIGNDAVLLIELDGTNTSGLIVMDGAATISGLVINRGGQGIRLNGTGGSKIEGCFIGTNAGGTQGLGNGNGIIVASPNNTIGGTAPAQRNIISGNGNFGQIYIIGGTGTLVQGNYLGTDKNGTAAIDGTTGVELVNDAGATIGGTTAGARNVISGNSNGVVLNNTTPSVVQGNFIGTDATGTMNLNNECCNGVTIANCDNHLIGGTASGAGNVISGNGVGIFIGGVSQGSNNTVQGNFIGTNAAGTAAIPNASGVLVDLGSSIHDNLIGGTTAAARNVISGNQNGVTFNNNDFNNAGINNTLQGNFIGTKADGISPLGNTQDGIFVNNVFVNSGGNQNIGGTVAGAGNVIAFNGGNGVLLSGFVTGIAIQGNAIHDNGGLGIDLGNDTVTPNDDGDADSGANNLQNFPVLTSVTNDGTSTTIAGTLNSTANSTFFLEFFSNSIRDASGFGQGENFIGSTQVTTDGSGDGSFNLVVPQGSDGQWFVAIATNLSGDTSEFSASVAVAGPVILNTTAVTARNGQAFKFRVLTAGGNPTERLTVTGLPPGLSADPVTGVISGTPTTDGGYDVLVAVTDGPVTLQSTLQIGVVSDPGIPVIVSPSVVNVPIGQPFTYQIEAPVTSLPTDPTTFSILGTLPPGLTFNATTGVISGTVAVMSARGGGDDGDVKELTGGALLGVIQMFGTNSRGRTTSPLALLQLPPVAVNISTRLPVGTNENVLIGGFIITGNAPKIVIIRGIGPSLGAVGVQGALQDPQLELRNASGALLAFNDEWRSDQEADIEETTIPPTNEHEAAIVAVLEPGNYTATLRGAGNSTGIAVVEAYDLGTASMDIGSDAELANISTRGFVNTGNDIMIGGIISANGTARFMIRAIGPSLTGSIQGALQDPTLELRNVNGTLLSSNDNWKTRPDGSSQQAEIEATTIPPTNNLESALVQMVAPGNYTAILRGKNNTTGIAVVEAYNLR